MSSPPRTYPVASRLVVISGPSGSGKTSICRQLAVDPRVAFSVSATTRPQRAGEVDGRDYFFLTEDQFEERVRAGAFLEHARYNEHRYGTLRAQVERQLAAGKAVLLEIEVQGTRQLRGSGVDGIYIFVMPPSFGELERRLRERRTEEESAIRRRLDIARREMEMAHLYDHVVINRDLQEAIATVRQLIGLGTSEDRT
jgi:guanylate kinase